MQAFETSEYRARLDKVRALMSDAGLDALLVINEGNMCYLTGYEGFSDYVAQAVLVTLDEDPYIVLRECDVRNAEVTCWLPQDRLIGYGESYIGAADSHPWTAIGEFVKGKVAASARIGAEFTAQRGRELGVTDYRRLIDALGVDEVYDGSGLVQKVKVVKSERELSYLNDAAAIVDRAMLVGIDTMAVGVRQADVVAAVQSALISGTEGVAGGPSLKTPFMPVGPVGGFPNAPHLKWSDEVYQAGQQTSIEIGGFRRRYGTPLARTAYLGTPTQQLREISKGVIEAWHAGFDAMRPGATCSDVARTVGSVLKRYGIEKDSRCGYSIGVDWLDGGASLSTNDHTELVPNMTFHLLLGIYERDKGYNFSESVLVTENGAQSLSNVARVLFEVPA